MSNLSVGDANHALVRAFDESTNSFRNTLTGAEVEIAVSAFTDSIKIGDGAGSTATITTIGAKKALDVVVNDITIDHADDSIRLGDGTNLISASAVSGKTGLDVNVINSQTATIAPSGQTALTYGTIGSLAIGASYDLITYTASGANDKYVQKVYFSGSQVGSLTIEKNSVVILKTRLSPTTFTQIVDLATGSAFGILLNSGDVFKVIAENNGTGVAEYDATLQLMVT